MSFADFMNASLYDPFHGYYASGRARIGRAGDFYTAVSSGPLFGRLLACQFTEMWEAALRPKEWTLVEQGAAAGTLSTDVLNHLQTFAPECYANSSLKIVEPFSHFQRQQSRALCEHLSKVSWHRSIQSLPKFSGVHFSNELLDAFPVHKVTFSQNAWIESKVDYRDDRFQWCDTPIDHPKLHEKALGLKNPTEGQSREICLPISTWIADLKDRMQFGWVIAFDYGMSEEELSAAHRNTGTITAYRSHQRQSDVLDQPGSQDLTAHVNFTDVSKIAAADGWEISGYTDQCRFLTGLAPLHFRDKSTPLTREEQRETLNFRTLTHPQLMGGQFKALCLATSGLKRSFLSGFKWAKDPHSILGL